MKSVPTRQFPIKEMGAAESASGGGRPSLLPPRDSVVSIRTGHSFRANRDDGDAVTFHEESGWGRSLASLYMDDQPDATPDTQMPSAQYPPFERDEDFESVYANNINF